MLLSARIKFAVALWFILEALLFAVVVKLVGLGGAILLGLLTSLIGLSTLRRAGASAMAKMRHSWRGRGGAPIEVRDETLATLGAVALLVPGFLSDIVGLVLITPVLRNIVGRRIAARVATRGGRPRAQHGPSVIDLDPEEWRPVDAASRPLPRA